MGETSRNENAVLKAALDYYDRGWCVIPVPVGSKKARIQWKQYQQQRPDEAQIQRWFASGKQNVALICGPVSDGLVVADFDEADLYYAWAAQNPELAGTLPTVKTARGYHVYCRASLTKTRPLQGIDVKASGYVLAPPSVHPTGALYEWIVRLNGSLTLIDFTEFGLNLTQEAQATQESQETQDSQEIQEIHSSSEVGVLVETMLSRCCKPEIVSDVAAAIIDTLPQKVGQRNHRIFLLAQRLKSIADYSAAEPKEAKAIVEVWHKCALPTIRTKAFELTWMDFTACWKKVKHPRLSGHLGNAIRSARSKLQAGTGLVSPYESTEVKLLLQTCYELRKEDGTFEMGCRRAGEIIGQSHETARNIMKYLEGDGWFTVIQCRFKHGILVSACLTHINVPPYRFDPFWATKQPVL